jgi:hypothetical protein
MGYGPKDQIPLLSILAGATSGAIGGMHKQFGFSWVTQSYFYSISGKPAFPDQSSDAGGTSHS